MARQSCKIAGIASRSVASLSVKSVVTTVVSRNKYFCGDSAPHGQPATDLWATAARSLTKTNGSIMRNLQVSWTLCVYAIVRVCVFVCKCACVVHIRVFVPVVQICVGVRVCVCVRERVLSCMCVVVLLLCVDLIFGLFVCSHVLSLVFYVRLNCPFI